MPIENRNLEAGTRLVAVHKRQTYTCEVQGDPPTFVLENGMTYKSPSAAAMAITETSTNGWRFWSVAGVDTIDEEALDGAMKEMPGHVDVHEPGENTAAFRELHPEPAGVSEDNTIDDADGPNGEAGGGNIYRSPAPKGRTLKLITRTPNQKGVQEGFVRIFCRACMDGHVVAVEDEDREGGPLEVCPRGHRQDDQALTGAPAAGVA